MFGKYVLLRPMARGGMGELFLAAAGETGGFEKLCVVKKVLTELEDGGGVRRRFLDEAKVVVRLNHANLVQVFDAGRVADDYYLSMELVEGKDLRGVWNRCAQLHRRIPVEFATFVVRELCRALEYVHDAMSLDLVHRDISPPNIMVSYHGQIKVTDFGLATHAIKQELTNPGVVFGRYSYLSPEQARGLPADRRTDIYAAGIVLWEMLTGRQLFPADRHQALGASALSELRNPKIKAPSSIVPGIPDGLDEVVVKALAVEREDRFQTAGEFKVALSEVLTRHHPSCDVDRVATFMRDIFAREYRIESQDYASYSREDFSPIRAQASIDESETLSISDAISLASTTPTPKPKPGSSRVQSGELNPTVSDRQQGGTSSIPLDDGDIDELESSKIHTGWDGGPTPAELAEAAAARVDTVVGKRYRVDRLLGVGGMGAVFAATHLALGKTYALKILHEAYGRDPDIIDRFMREARAATQTGHPNIIDVLDIGTMDEGDLYFVMELLDGTDLGTVIRQSGPLAVRRAVHVGRQICRALAAAHEAGIIHRDLKSENIVLIVKGSDPDFVKVLDFGICKHINSINPSQTSPGMVMGSPAYMAPEQAAGAAADVKSDVYALGTILFEMLTGHLPFTGRNAIAVLMKKGSDEAPSVAELRPEVPAPLVEVVARCLDLDLERRPDSMKSLEYELTRAIEGRASAVAAVMGLQLDAEAAASASGSGPQQRALGPPPAEASITEVPAKLVTVHDQAMHAAAAARVAQAAAGSGDKPLQTRQLGYGVLIGVALVALTVLGIWATGLGGGSGSGSASADGQQGASEGGRAGEDASADSAALGDTGSAQDTAGPEADTAGPDTGGQATGNPDDEVAAIVARAEQALAEERWREPLAKSLAFEIHSLSNSDPGHEAIGRLRRGAEQVLGPRARKSAKAKDWEPTAAAYRDLLAIWPEHADARENLLEALRQLAREQRADANFLGLLSTADELLNRDPDMFVALKYRAEALEGLERWSEAVPAYREAMRARPANKDVKKAYRKALRELTAQEHDGDK
ncbi:serine/threonine protein kinase [Enhygromyxa salina]|uniref:Serine/threonine protein kinase n=1 Tax=Enhygromyxa salina TaxID=215803 RepID=A0A0C1Z3X1_9BACT|nr:serine/threonine protein kinase [Enhygromyxa salina]